MASELRVNTLKDAAGNNSVGMEYVANGSAKCWVNFNGTSTVAIRGSLNTSSITDRGTGQYTVNKSTSFANTNFAFMAGAGEDNASGTVSALNAWQFTTSTTKINSFEEYGGTTARNDRTFLFAGFNGDLA